MNDHYARPKLTLSKEEKEIINAKYEDILNVLCKLSVLGIPHIFTISVVNDINEQDIYRLFISSNGFYMPQHYYNDNSIVK